jgi:hypothetical protein
MKCSTARWTTAFAAAALLGLPAAGWSQSPPATPSTRPPTSQQTPAAAPAQQGAAQEHIRLAQAALKDVESASLPAKSKSKVTDLKRHLSSLEKSSSASTTGSKTAKPTWADDVAAIDKILTELLGPATTSAATEPAGAAGTTGKPKTTTATLDDATKAKLAEVRTHVTAFAAAMSGAPAPDAAAPSPDPAAAAPAAQPSASAEPATPPAQTPPQSAAATTSPMTSSPAEPSQQQAPAATPQSNPDEAKRHLSAARESLSQLTQLPAAAQLQGESRNQVSQLISNFNELITTKENWRATYDKVNSNVMMLLSSEAAAPAEPAPTGTPGAVGTSGAVALDPAIRGKLVEFKEHLTKFEKAAGTASDASPSASAPAPSADASATPAASAPASAAPAATPSTPAATPSGPAETASPAAAASPAASPDQKTADSPKGHLDAIEAILNGSGQASAASGLTLTSAQVEQLRTHLKEVRKALEKK